MTAPRSRFACLFASMLAAANAARANDIHVTGLVDNGTACTLREAIRSANTNTAVGGCEAGDPGTDRILVMPGTHTINLTAGNNEDLSVTGDLDLTESVQILGVATDMSIIDGSGGGDVDRLLDVHAGATTVLIEKVTLRGGNPTDGARQGGVIRLENGSTLTLNQVDVEGGTARTGGGIYSGGVLTLTDSRIADNQTLVEGATGNHGGGIAHAATGGALMISDSTIAGNDAEESGAGLYVLGGPLTIKRSQVTDNFGGGNGGGLFVSSPNYSVTYSEFAGNHANNGGGVYLMEMGDVLRCAFVDNTAVAAGGGLHDAFGGFIRFSTLAGNVAAQGGGVYANATQTLLDSDTIATNSGGGVFNQHGVSFEDTIVARNAGGNCTGNPPLFGAYNMEDVNSCGFVSGINSPNFPNTDPKLGPLGFHGGPTRSISLLHGSPAVDAVSSQVRTNCENMLDQRGHGRGRPRVAPDLFLCDIGAFELTQPFRVNSFADGVDADPNDDRCKTAGNLCTLRAAIQQANATVGADEIVLPPGTLTLSISGTGENLGATGDLDIDPPLEIRGVGSAVGGTIINGVGLDRVFDLGAPPYVASDVDRVELRDLTITGGDAGGLNGGGILLEADFPLDLIGVRLTGNHAARGSAISSSTGTFFGTANRPVHMISTDIESNTGGMALFLHDARMERSSLINNNNSSGSNGGGAEFLAAEIVNSTISGNHASATGAFFANSAVMDSSTIHNNTADFAPGGVFLLERSAFRNSIVSLNKVGATSMNCSSNSLGIGSAGHNLTDTASSDCDLTNATDTVSTNPLLGALANNGGPTQTHLPLAGRPAIDHGDPLSCPAADQRPSPRPRDGDNNGSSICDIGAVEIPEPGFLLGLGSGCAMLAVLSRRRRT